MVKKILISTFIFIFIGVSSYFYFISELNQLVKKNINKVSTFSELPNLTIKDSSFEEANLFIPNTLNIRNIRSYVIDREFFINALFQINIESINANFNLFGEKKFELEIKGIRTKLYKLNVEKNNLSPWISEKEDQLNVYFESIDIKDLPLNKDTINKLYLNILKLVLHGKSDYNIQGSGFISYREINTITRIPFKILNSDNKSSLVFNQQDIQNVVKNFANNQGPSAIERIFQNNPVNIITLLDLFSYISGQTTKYPDLQRIKIENYNILLFSYLTKIYFSEESISKEIEPLFKEIFRNKDITDRDYNYYITSGKSKYEESVKENDLRYSVRK